MVTLRWYLRTIFLLSLFIIGDFRKTFLDYIPNGKNVPNPCTTDSNDVWRRVGHKYLDYLQQPPDKPKNGFGQKFLSLKNTFAQMSDIWKGTETIPGLCQDDSDGDGRTNGVELGDPKCQWNKGETPLVTNRSRLSHPGIPDEAGGTMTQKNKDLYCLGQHGSTNKHNIIPVSP